MNGYGSHTYSWIDAGGQISWVKYHFISDQGVEFLTQAEADRLAGIDADYHQRDLHEALKRGDYPTWTLKMQIMPFHEAKSYRFNPFDLTATSPTTTRRSSKPRSSPTTRCPVPDSARTKCCWHAASPMPTRTGPASGSTTSRSR
jgi:hypothetical protein